MELHTYINISIRISSKLKAKKKNQYTIQQLPTSQQNSCSTYEVLRYLHSKFGNFFSIGQNRIEGRFAALLSIRLQEFEKFR